VIDEVLLQRLLPGPDPTATHCVDLLFGHSATPAHAIEERVVKLLDLVDQLLPLFGREAPKERLGVGAWRRLVGVHGDADLAEEPADIRLAVEHADRPGDRQR